MRIWDVSPKILCKNHLLGEHRELHGCWNILVHNKKGYFNHPETQRWIGKLPALKKRHDALVAEMKARWPNGTHNTELVETVTGSDIQDVFIDNPIRQIEILQSKGCACKTSMFETAETQEEVYHVKGCLQKRVR